MVVHLTCRSCGLVLLQPAGRCPACGGEDLVPVRSSRSMSREAAASGRPEGPGEEDGETSASRPTEWEIAYRCPDQFVALTLQAELDRHGITSWIRSLELPGYEGLIQNQPTWGWLLVDRDDMAEAAVIIHQFLEAIEKGEE